MIKTVSIIGMGALGMLYGRNLTRALGYENVTFLMDRERYERNKDKTCVINGEEFRFHMIPEEEAKIADLVIVAVKYPGLPGAIEVMRGCVGDDTVIISVMNGISSEKILAEHFGEEKIVYTVAQGMDAARFGQELTFSKSGALHFGLVPGSRKENLDAVTEVLARAELDYVLEDDIIYRMWGKYMLNVGCNQTCMVYQATYGDLSSNEEVNYIFISAMREVLAVANAEGVRLTEADLSMYAGLMKTLGPKLMPSMAQDRINGNPSEVDAFSGELIRHAEKHGILVPVNRYLNRRAKEIEAEYLK
ncbi:MAG: ketopantoate reductase family protein [Lachnospiraceae bacterium]|nr:ketopantoate reductase family protein [Lachnospiraceae bacterium]